MCSTLHARKKKEDVDQRKEHYHSTYCTLRGRIKGATSAISVIQHRLCIPHVDHTPRALIARTALPSVLIDMYMDSGCVGRVGYSCKRSLTHHPSSQGWASRCPMFVCMYLWGGGGELSVLLGWFPSYFFCRRSQHCEVEKRRRERMNRYMNELAQMIPTCAAVPRRLDKLSILKMAVDHMKSLRGMICIGGQCLLVYSVS